MEIGVGSVEGIEGVGVGGIEEIVAVAVTVGGLRTLTPALRQTRRSIDGCT